MNQTEVCFPEILYHGTIKGQLPELLKNFINPEKWKYQRDFGPGLYLTIDFNQAQNFAFKKAARRDDIAVVLQVDCSNDFIQSYGFTGKDFIGPSLKWARFILEHRLQRQEDEDPCSDEHPDIVSGPMADNNIAKAVNRYKETQDIYEFYDMIRKKPNHKRLDGLELGHQIVFSNNLLAEHSLRIRGWYEYTNRRWDYHDATESI